MTTPIPHTIALNPNPWIPQPGINDPNSRKVQKAFQTFLDAQSNEELRSALSWAYGSITYISFPVFSEMLKRVVGKINRRLEDKPFVLLVVPEKSSKWVAELAMQYFVRPPQYVVNLREFDQFMKKNPEIRTSVFLDDVACTGNQLTRYLQNRILFTYRLTGHQPFEIILGIPFITPRAINIIREMQAFEPVGKITLFSEIGVASARKKMIDPSHVSVLQDTYYGAEVLKKIEVCLRLGNGLREEEFSSYLSMAFMGTLRRVHFPGTDFLMRFMLYVQILEKENETITLYRIYEEPHLRLLADLIYRDLEKFIPLFRVRIDLECLTTQDEEIAFGWLFHFFDEAVSLDGLHNRSLLIFDHGSLCERSTLAPFSSGITRDVSGDITYHPFFTYHPGYRSELAEV